MNYKLIHIAAILLSLFASSPASGVTIHWGNALGEFIYQSDGTTAVDNTFSFELGTFSDGFDPQLANASEWEANWHLLDTASYNPTVGWFSGSVSLAADGTVSDGSAVDGSYFFGKDAYIWIYNQNTTIDNTLEWTLLSNPDGGGNPASAWTFPTAVDIDARDVDSFILSDPGVEAGFGQETSGGGTTTGAGAFEATPSVGYAIQTFTIPEPSTANFLLLSLVTLGITRRRVTPRIT